MTENPHQLTTEEKQAISEHVKKFLDEVKPKSFLDFLPIIMEWVEKYLLQEKLNISAGNFLVWFVSEATKLHKVWKAAQEDKEEQEN